MSTAKNSILSSALLILESFSQKAIGLISTIILARVLIPEDFGIVAISTIVIGFLVVFAETGSHHYILRAETVTTDMLNTSWTLDLCLRSCISLSLVLSTSAITDYYQDARLQNILYIMALMLVLDGLQNPGLLLLKRDQDYSKIVKLSVSTKIISVIIAISAALTLRNYWALVLGQLASSLLMTVGSYIVHTYKPRICLNGILEQWKFSRWFLPQAILGQLRTQFDSFFVSSFFGKADLGSYHTLKYLAYIPSAQIITPLTAPLLVQLSQIRDNQEYFNLQYRVTFLITMLVSIPLASVMFFYSDLIIAVLLGTQWIAYAELFGILGLILPAFAIFKHATRTLHIFAQPKIAVFYEIIAFITFVISIYSINITSIFELAWLKAAVENVLTIFYLCVVTISYTNVATLLKLLSQLFWLTSFSIASLLISSIVQLKLGSVFDLALHLSLFSLTFIGLSIVSHILVKHKSSELQYLEKSFKKLRTPMPPIN